MSYIKHLNLMILLPLLFSCGNKKSNGSDPAQVPLGLEINTELDLNYSADLKNWSDLFLGQSKMNPVMGDFLAPLITDKERFYLADKLDLSTEEINSLEKAIAEEENLIRKRLLGIESEYTETLLKASLIGQKISNEKFISNQDSSKILYASKLRDEYLNTILTTYQKTITKHSKELSPFIAQKIVTQDPEGAKSILTCVLSQFSEESCIKQIERVISLLEQGDKLFKGTALNNYEQFTVLLAGAGLRGISYQVYQQLKGTKKWEIMASYGTKAQELFEKYREVKILAKAIEEYANKINKDCKEFKDISKKISSNISQLINETKDKLGDASLDIIEKKRIFRFMQDKLNGKSNPEGQESIFTRPVKVDHSIQTLIETSGRLATNFSSILRTTQTLAATFKVKLPQEVTETMEMANKVSAAVTLAQGVIGGLSSNGPLGAFQAIISGPGSNLLGARVETFETMALEEFSQINIKLDEIQKLANEIKSLQLITLGQIKDLATMVHIYHQEAMDEVYDLRMIAIDSNRKLSYLLAKDILACEQLISQSLSIRYFNNSISFSPSHAHQMKGLLRNPENGLNFLRSNDLLHVCATGLANIFDGNDSYYLLKEDVVPSKGSEIKDLNTRMYRPLLNFLPYKDLSTEMGLHMPTQKIKDQKYKRSLKHNFSGSSEKYYMERLFSTDKLEGYVSLLIVSHRLLNVNAGFWSNPTSLLFEKHAAMDWKNYFGRTLGHDYLIRALRLVQSGLAQESVLSGEPILMDLREEMPTILKKNLKIEDCKARTMASSPDCSILMNPLLLRNVMKFQVNSHSNKSPVLHRYQEAYHHQSFSELSQIIFGDKLFASRFISKEDGVYFKSLLEDDRFPSPILVKVPTPYEMSMGLVEYRDHVSTLLEMQEVLIDEISQYELNYLPFDQKMSLLKRTLKIAM